MLSEERKAELLVYCRLDTLTPQEDALLETFYQAAVGYMTEAGIAEPDPGTPRRAQYDLCVNAMVLDNWDRRGTSFEARSGHTMAENRSFQQTLTQLELTEPPVSKLDTGNAEGGG